MVGYGMVIVKAKATRQDKCRGARNGRAEESSAAAANANLKAQKGIKLM